ncbi:MAG TPA: FAD-binding oxidoreductase [Anaerolineales bacterium]|nr:FAD-binding oxidoreductase [Anaerolineales bacterium]
MSLALTQKELFQDFENFGHSLNAPSIRFSPKNNEELHEAFKEAERRGFKIAFRGAGRSYNDAALNGGGMMVTFENMKEILEWDPESGIVTVQPGISLGELWQRVLPDGWWPPVVSGTMTTTLGGCLGMNIHGKNNFRLGTIGEHVLKFNALLPNGAEITCSPDLNSDLFYSMIGGLGMLGAFTSITLKMKRVYSGFLRVTQYPVQNLNLHLEAIECDAPLHDYTVGWLDATAGGDSLGRGQIHVADYLHDGEDSDPATSLRVDHQTLPATMFGFFPKSIIHYFMTPFMNNFGTRFVNSAKYLASLRTSTYLQSHAAFHFLLDYVPNWELAYGKQGLIQYQTFLPKASALDTWKEMLITSQKRGIPSYLGVTKRHRPDQFLLSHAVDGFSLAFDFKITKQNRRDLRTMLTEFDNITTNNGGRFYLAKNSETSSKTALAYLGKPAIEKFIQLKKRTDPDFILESDLFQRIFGAFVK